MRLRMRGKVWEFVRQRAGLGAANVGHCDAPNVRGKKIIVDHTLKGEDELDVIIHELLHAAHWDLDEQAVKETAADLSRCLYKLGYRKVT